MSDAENQPADPSDLENLLNGLDMTPDWARSDPGVRSEPPKRDRYSDRPQRRDTPRAPRGGQGRRNMAGVRVKPSREEQSSGAGHDEYRRAPRAPRLPVHVDFIPEKQRLSKVVKIIRASHRAFPLEEIASKFMENPAFVAVKLTVRENAPDAEEMIFHQCRADGMVFSDQGACEAYILDHGIPEYFEFDSREVPPPAGNFVCVGRHRRSKALIGPPNWHGYAKAVEEARVLHAPDQDRDHFASNIEMVHEEEVIEEWKKAVSVQKFYRLKPQAKKAEDAPAKASAASKEASDTAAATAESATAESAATEASTEEVTPATEPAASEAQPVATEAVEESAKETEPDASVTEPVAETEASPSEEDAAEDATPAEDLPYDLTQEQAETLFREKYLSRFMTSSRRSIMPGYLIEKMEDAGIRSSVEFHLRREQQKPSSIVFALRPAFKHMRLQLFRHNGAMHASGIHPNPLSADEHIAEDLKRILDHLAEHDGSPSKDVLLALGPEQGEGVEPKPELVSHLHWLIEKGHVIEFSNGTLSLPHQKRS